MEDPNLIVDPVKEETGVKQELTSEEQEINPKGGIVVRNEKGQVISGTPNPNGRPKGKRSFSTLFKEAIETLALSKNTTAHKIEMDLITRGILEAMGGDFYFWNSVVDRLHGKPATKISFDDEVEGVEVKIIRNRPNDSETASN